MDLTAYAWPGPTKDRVLCFYLLALAVHHRGCPATLHGGVAIQMVLGVTPANLLRLLP